MDYSLIDVDWDALGSAVVARLAGDSQRSLERTLKVGFEPVNRLCAGKPVGTKLFMRACIWLGIPAETFILKVAENN